MKVTSSQGALTGMRLFSAGELMPLAPPPSPGSAAAIYDSTLNFRNDEPPSLLDILNGKKYHADLYVR